MLTEKRRSSCKCYLVFHKTNGESPYKDASSIVGHVLSYTVTPLILTHFESQIPEAISNWADLYIFTLGVLLNYSVPWQAEGRSNSWVKERGSGWRQHAVDHLDRCQVTRAELQQGAEDGSEKGRSLLPQIWRCHRLERDWWLRATDNSLATYREIKSGRDCREDLTPPVWGRVQRPHLIPTHCNLPLRQIQVWGGRLWATLTFLLIMHAGDYHWSCSMCIYSRSAVWRGLIAALEYWEVCGFGGRRALQVSPQFCPCGGTKRASLS